MKRKLASIQIITAIDPIPEADSIAAASVLGWKVVVSKEEFKVGDKVIYFEIDSVLPQVPEFEFMAKRNYRVKTIKLRGQLSQGLCAPTSVLNSFEGGKGLYLYEGFDVTDIIGVKKYEIPELPGHSARLSGDQAGVFPSFLVSKTDEIRLQAIPGILKELPGLDLYLTIKMDGTSSTYVRKNDDIMVCSRNFIMKDGDTVYWDMARKYDIINILKRMGNYAIQGEICGPGIQRNPIGLVDRDLYVFNVWDVDAHKYLPWTEMKAFCDLNGLRTVPFIGMLSDTTREKPVEYTIEEFLNLARGTYLPSGKPREGIVVRSADNTYSKTLHGPLSFKVINNDFLLKEK